MPNIDLSILNQRQTPAFYADVFANRPAAGFVGRIFISTNTFAFYRDNGTSWDLIGGPGTGTVTGTGANGQVTFWNGASTITGSNDLFWDATNGHLGVNTNAPGTALDVHHDQNTVAILNQTVATNDVRIGFQNNGVGLWRIGAFYNAGANDWGIFDVVGAAQPFTIKKTTGQTFIGAETTSSGRLVVNNSTGDNHIVVIGANSPSIRVRNNGSTPFYQFGLGLSTAANNFIQGSFIGDFCIFNNSLIGTKQILFGIYNIGSGNTEEAVRIAQSKNFLIGTTTDAGYKLDVAGTFHAGTTSDLYYDGANLGLGTLTPVRRLSVNNGAIGIFNTATGQTATDGFVFSINGTDALITNFENSNLIFQTNNTECLRFQNTGSATFVSKIGIISAPTGSESLQVYGTTYLQQNTSIGGITASCILDVNPSTNTVGNGIRIQRSNVNTYTLITAHNSISKISAVDINSGQPRLQFNYSVDGTNFSTYGEFSIAQNFLIGTTTDAGEKLQVAGTARIQNTIRVNANGTTSVSTSATQISTGSNTYGGLAIVWGADSGGNIFTDFLYYSLGTFNVLASQTVSGGPAGRTYSVDGSGNLRLTMGSGTYNIRYQGLLTA